MRLRCHSIGPWHDFMHRARVGLVIAALLFVSGFVRCGVEDFPHGVGGHAGGPEQFYQRRDRQ